jgi:hypothetical protein
MCGESAHWGHSYGCLVFQIDFRWVCLPEFSEPSPRSHIMSIYNLRAAALTNVNLRSLNVEFERREQLKKKKKQRKAKKQDLNIDDELIATMEDARKSGGYNVPEQSDLNLRKFPIDL